jgi:hypothetical protein
MTYVNNLTPTEISDMLMSISNSLYREYKTHQNCPHVEEILSAYKMSIDLDRHISYYILRHNKECINSH